MKYTIFLSLLLISFFSNSNQLKQEEPEDYPPIDIIQSDKDLSLFNTENAKLILTKVKNGGSRGANEIVMYDKDSYSKTNEWGYEAQINENFEVVAFDTNVKMLENGYILSGHSEGGRTIKEKISVGEYAIFIKEINTVYIFESKKEYKYAYYIFKINNYLKNLNEKMIKENLYEKIYDELNDINTEYKKALENIDENIIKIYTTIKELYKKTFENKEKIDFSKLSYINTIKLDKFEYIELYTSKKGAVPQNFIYNLTVSHEGGARGENELVKYDESNIRDRNQYGFEVSVNSNGNVIDKGITVELPEGGYILSGHGTNRQLISDQVQIGDYILYKDLKVSVYRDTTINVVNNIGKQIDKLVLKFNDLIENKIPLYYDEIAKKINYLISYYNSLDKEEISFDIYTYFYLREFDYESLLLETKFLFIESNPVQIQALWHTPNSISHIFDESTKEGVQNFVKACSESGFNRIYVETNSRGVSYYHSDILTSHDIFGKPYGEYRDYLECLIEEAHKVNIEIITWVQVLRALSSAEDTIPACYKEEWLSKDYDGKRCTFLDSTNPEVHKFLISQFSEIVNNYNNDGLEYDYIRYESSNILSYPSSIIDYGYTENGISMFKKKYGYDSSEDIKVILEDKKARTRWVEFKKQRITDLLTSSQEELRMIRPNLILTAAVFPDPDSIDSIMQDWPEWLNKELIDYVEPMIYQKDTNYFINHQVDNFISRIINTNEEYRKNKVVVGVGTVISGGDYLEYFDQIGYVLSLHHSYTIFFAGSVFSFSKLNNTLVSYNYKPISYTSTFEDKMDAITNDLIKKIEGYYENISEEDFSGLVDALKKGQKEKKEENVEEIIEEINKIKDEKIQDNIYGIFMKINSK